MFNAEKVIDGFISHLPDLIKAIVSFCWLILAGFAFWKFYSPLKSAIESRSLSVEIGGFKLSFQEATEGLKKQISDLQTKVAKLENSFKPAQADDETVQSPETPESVTSEFPDEHPPVTEPGSVAGPTRSASNLDDKKSFTPALHVLWVDDNPKGNAYEIGTIQSDGGTVETARSTSEALSKFESGHHNIVITDMGRREDGSYNGTAGIQLIEAIRNIDKRTPIFVYTSVSQVKRKKALVEAAGGNGITSSPVELFELLRTRDR